ncbi:MAG: LysM peptidoglycan-binding domain-containing protein [Clostridia bacterium]|nr:LysM peptidoglycan-binding domain-containing protein [Clostridia bacterium]
MKRNKQNSKKRILIENVVIILFIFSVLHIISNSLFASKTIASTEQTVLRGQTLWTIAENISMNYDKDINEVIYDIKKLNNLEESVIYEGQLLNIPKYL